ncbi:MAG: hypothetical protein EZS28_026256 [Streblomastix strix]|uniref:Uncharacterized protein n=1 Tax=Streblomastix strix TaxID=222440 RepID=A0A5J4V6G5_9EUKA|nr:MAG: hypothetical protein EZS28_026256 [Streblomastix strix]
MMPTWIEYPKLNADALNSKFYSSSSSSPPTIGSISRRQSSSRIANPSFYPISTSGINYYIKVVLKLPFHFVKNALTSARIVYRYAVIAIPSYTSSSTSTTQFFSSSIGQSSETSVTSIRHKLDFEQLFNITKRRAIRGSKSGSGMQTLSGSCAGGLEETEAELLSGAGMGVGASIDELIAGTQQGKGSGCFQFNKWNHDFSTAFIQQLILDVENGQKDGFAILDEDYLLDIEPIVGGEDDEDEQNFEFNASAFSGGYSIQVASSLNSNCSTLYPNSSPFQLLLQSFQAFCVAIEASLLISNYSQTLRFCQLMLTTLIGSGLFSQQGRTHPAAVRSVVVMVEALKTIPQPKLTGFINKTSSNQQYQYQLEQQNSIICPISSYPDRIPSPQSNTSQSPLYITPQLLAKQQQLLPQPNAESIDATLKAEYWFQAQPMIDACLSELVQCDLFPEISRNYAAQQIKVRRDIDHEVANQLIIEIDNTLHVQIEKQKNIIQNSRK